MDGMGRVKRTWKRRVEKGSVKIGVCSEDVFCQSNGLSLIILRINPMTSSHRQLSDILTDLSLCTVYLCAVHRICLYVRFIFVRFIGFVSLYGLSLCGSSDLSLCTVYLCAVHSKFNISMKNAHKDFIYLFFTC